MGCPQSQGLLFSVCTMSYSQGVLSCDWAPKQYSIKITLVFHAHATKKHLLQALERKKNTRKEVREMAESSFFHITSHPENMSVCFPWLFILHYDI